MAFTHDPMRSTLGGTPEQFASELLARMRVTRGALFEGYRRLSRKAEVSHLSISMLSIYAIAASLFSIFLLGHRDAQVSKYISFTVLSVSSFILFLNSFEFGKRYDHKAHKQNAVALEISHLCNRLELAIRSASVTDGLLREIVDHYRDALSHDEGSHSNIDFFYFLLGQRVARPIRLSLFDDDIQKRFGKPHYQMTVAEIDEAKTFVRLDYERKKQEYKDNFAQYMKSKYIRWMDINLSLFLFVLCPVVVIPLGYVIVLDPGLFKAIFIIVSSLYVDIIRYFIVFMLYFIPFLWAIYRILQGRSVLVFFEVTSYYVLVSSILYIVSTRHLFDYFVYATIILTSIVLVSKPLRLKDIGKLLGNFASRVFSRRGN
jgi:hypothetical protein